MLPGIVLAAGRSLRFGSPKALAPTGAGTFISQILKGLSDAGISERVVVVREGDDELVETLTKTLPGVRTVPNPNSVRGQLSSLLVGLEAVDGPEIAGVLVMLVDMPLVTASTIRRLVDAASSSSAAVIRASYGGRHGHPVVFKRAAFDALRRADPAVGAKAVVHALTTEDVQVDDRGVLEDIDTREDYQRLFGDQPSRGRRDPQ
jgi:CTP:molybdopterin cytidylyltransferase MocA